MENELLKHEGCSLDHKKSSCFSARDGKTNFLLGLLLGVGVVSFLMIVMMFVYLGKVGAPGIGGEKKTAESIAPQYEQCLASSQFDDQVSADEALASKVGINGTPGFFLNGYQISGALPLDYLTTTIKDLLAGKVPNDFEGKGKLKKVDLPAEATQGPVRGADNGKITMVLFDDFECPYCAKFFATEEALLQTFPNDLKIIFHNLPLSFHKFARSAANAAECANDQGKFWEYAEILFANQSRQSQNDLINYAAELNLDNVKFQSCLESKVNRQIVSQDIKGGNDLKILGTPTILFDGQEVSDWRNLDQLAGEKINN